MPDISKIKLPSDNTIYNLKDASALHTIAVLSPITFSDSGGDNGPTIAHENSGVTAGSKGDTANQTPAFGGTFKALSATVNATGHITALSEHTVTIPSAVATTTTAGLMSAADKALLEDLATRLAYLESVAVLASNAIDPYTSGEGVSF